MGKIIITHDNAVRPIDALEMVRMVVVKGRISEARGYSKYCHATVFGYGNMSVVVYTRDVRKPGTDSFDIRFQ